MLKLPYRLSSACSVGIIWAVLAACSGPLNNRQLVSGSELRTVFTGQVTAITKVQAENSDFFSYGQLANALAVQATGPGAALDPFTAGTAASTITDDLYALYTKSRCLYLINPDESAIAQALESRVLGAFSSQPQQTIAFAQVCNPLIEDTTRVMVTVGFSGATIHPIGGSIPDLRFRTVIPPKISGVHK